RRCAYPTVATLSRVLGMPRDRGSGACFLLWRRVRWFHAVRMTCLFVDIVRRLAVPDVRGRLVGGRILRKIGMPLILGILGWTGVLRRVDPYRRARRTRRGCRIVEAGQRTSTTFSAGMVLGWGPVP